MKNNTIQAALNEWKKVLEYSSGHRPKIKIFKATETLDNCIATPKNVIAILFPFTEKEVIDCVVIANKFNIPLYPVSTGNNWGYGSSSPVTNQCVVLNLSKMDQILEFDSEMGVVTVQPGVTQRKLAQYLDTNDYAYLIPVTGAGPDCSILGNAIERGYGVTPYADHFISVMSLNAVLADGSIYKPALSQLGSSKLDGTHKWGVGPYIDGLFTQSNFGIVINMTIVLAPSPERIESFFFSVKNTQDLDEIVLRIRKILKEFSGITGSINLMNQHRMLAMTEPYPTKKLVEGLMPDLEIKKMALRRKIMVWTGVGTLYGNKAIVKAAKKEIKKILRPVAKRLLFLNPDSTHTLLELILKTPIINQSIVAKTLITLDNSLQLFSGRPSEIALPLAYWISGNKPESGKPLKPDRDNCGLIWYSPLVPMRPEQVKAFCNMVEVVCKKHKIEPLITLTSLSDRCFDSTIPILFNKHDSAAVARAHACFDELFDSGRDLGFAPYRLGIHAMDKLTQYNAVPSILKNIKQAVDPNGIISPGRYLPEDSQNY